MMAVALDRYGAPDVLSLRECPQPRPAAGEVLVEVAACGVNPLDWKARAGHLAGFMPHRLPLIPGWDVVGRVVELGDGVSPDWLDADILALADYLHDGGYAEYARVAVDRLVRRPAALAVPDAASLPTPGLTAMQAIRDAGAIELGERIVVTGAAGTVGRIALQIAARIRGVEVIAAIRRNATERLPRTADVDIVHVDDDGLARLRGSVDFVFDTVGGALLAECYRLPRRGGRLVTAVQPVDSDACESAGIDGRFILVQNNVAQLAELARLRVDGQLDLGTIETLPLAQAAEAHARLEAGGAGRLVLVP